MTRNAPRGLLPADAGGSAGPGPGGVRGASSSAASCPRPRWSPTPSTSSRTPTAGWTRPGGSNRNSAVAKSPPGRSDPQAGRGLEGHLSAIPHPGPLPLRQEALRAFYRAPSLPRAQALLERLSLSLQHADDAKLVRWGRTLHAWKAELIELPPPPRHQRLHRGHPHQDQAPQAPQLRVPQPGHGCAKDGSWLSFPWLSCSARHTSHLLT